MDDSTIGTRSYATSPSFKIVMGSWHICEIDDTAILSEFDMNHCTRRPLLQRPNFDPIDNQRRIATQQIPRVQPLLTAIPECCLGEWLRIVPGLAASITSIREESIRTADGQIHNEEKLHKKINFELINMTMERARKQ